MVFINKTKKLVFIHIPKTGGKTIKKSLEEKYKNDWSIICDSYGKKKSIKIISDYLHPIYSILIYNIFGLCYGNKYNLQPFHSTINEIKNEINLNDYYLFTSVRNPYNRFCSCFYYIKRHIEYYFKAAKIITLLSLFLFFYFIKIGKETKSKNYILLGIVMLVNYCIINNSKAYKICSSFFYDINDFILFLENSNDPILKLTFLPQTIYLLNNNKLGKIDYIIHQENFDEEFKLIVDKYDLEFNESVNVNPSKKNYINELNSHSIKFLNNYYIDDFKNFNYDMI